MHDVLQFSVGDIVNPPNYTLRIIITSLEPLKARVVQTSDQKPVSFWFPLDRELLFMPGGPDNSWNLDMGPDMPWFILWVRDGEKRFTHYR